jgi:phage terminase large subunit
MLSDAVLNRFKIWREDAILFVNEVLLVNKPHIKITAQQKQFLSELPRKKRISIRSGHGTGKDASASWAVLWFLSTRIYAKVVCTAPTARQLNDILWSEISKWMRDSAIADEFVIQSDKIFYKGAPKEWWARAVSPSVKADPADQAETLAGFHGDHLLIIVDEASGVEDPVFIPIEGAMTQEDNRAILIGNPTKNKGYFHDTQFHPEISKQWFRLHWDSRDSENVKPEYAAYMTTKYGVDSNVFRIRVAGEPPLEDERTLIPLHWAEQCIGKDIEVDEEEPIYLGVDVARYGEDKSIILPRHGLKILPWIGFQGMNTITLAGHVLQTYQDVNAEGCVVDVIGVGAGTADYLRKKNMPGLFDVNVSWASSDPTKYALLRDELWWRVREKCMYGYYSFPDVKIPGETLSLGQEIANELSTPFYEFNRNGAIKVEGKKDMKKRGIPSPNIADALGLTEYFYSVATKVFRKKKVQYDRSRQYQKPGLFNYGRKVPGCDDWRTI